MLKNEKMRWSSNPLIRTGSSIISFAVLILISSAGGVWAQQNVYIADLPDYAWHRGCFGTATGNLMGFWDRNGYPDVYTGSANGGVAPTTSWSPNEDIKHLWASEAHDRDYWVDYESTDMDPYVTQNRQAHEPDCIGDFIGLNQNKWKNLNDECAGNIDGYSFVFWDKSGERRWNYQPLSVSGNPIADIPSGLKAFMQYCGYDCSVFSQLADVNPESPTGTGFTFEDVKAEIDAGFPVLLYLQDSSKLNRTVHGVSNVNPSIHGFLIYGYRETSTGNRSIRVRDSWSGGDNRFYPWDDSSLVGGDLPIRGVIGVHPLPRIENIERNGSEVTVHWSGPSATLVEDQVPRPAHTYVVEKSTDLENFQPVSDPTASMSVSFNDTLPAVGSVFYRVSIALQ